MEGCENATKSPGKPKAHLSLSLPTWLAAKPAASADWKRLFSGSELQPFHSPLMGFAGAFAAHIPWVEAAVSNFLAVTNSATAWRSARLRSDP
jgi:hypothetical protein